MSFRFSCDASEISLEVVHSYLTQSYWAEGIPVDVVEKSIANSLCFSMFDGARQIGFGRFITDRATYAYVADVFIVDEYQGQGIGTQMMKAAFAMQQVQGLRRMMLATAGAHDLYKKFGFTELVDSSIMMEKTNLAIYSNDEL